MQGHNQTTLPAALSGASFLKTPLTAFLGSRIQHDPRDVFWRIGNGIGEFKRRATHGAFVVQFFLDFF